MLSQAAEEISRIVMASAAKQSKVAGRSRVGRITGSLRSARDDDQGLAAAR
jgi:hypothetical protein